MRLSFKTAVLFIIIAVLAFPLASASTDLLNSKSLDMSLSIDSSFEIIQVSQPASLEYVSVDLSFFPRTSWRQSVATTTTEPKAEKSLENDKFNYRWDSPDETTISFSLSSDITTKEGFIGVNNKVDFPITNLDKELEEYTLPGIRIDSNNEQIIRVASSLASGEDDLYQVVFNAADWVKQNVEYDLNTFTSDVSQHASWVLKNKYGVCDEITTLFIALLRALDIPARYVSGVAYTNYNDINDFGPHGWAEVYFPGTGWIPFDITYNEFGYIDATHIALKRSADSGQSSTNYKWKGRFIDIETEKLSITTKVKRNKGVLEPTIQPITKAYQKNIGFGSYNIITAELINPDPFYRAVQAKLSQSNDLEIISDDSKNVLLKPFETKKVSWIIKIEENLNKDYIYTFNVGVYTERNSSSHVKFSSSKGETVFSKNDILQAYELLEEEETKTYSKQITINCKTNNNRIYLNETSEIQCTLKNTGNTFLEGLSVCLEECVELNLGISREGNANFTYYPDETGKKQVQIIAENKLISKSNQVEITVLDIPKLTIEDLDFPVEINFKKDYAISFMLKKLSESEPKNLVVELKHGANQKVWTLNALEDDREFVLNLNSGDFYSSNDEFFLKVEFEDERETTYKEETAFSIKLINPSLSDKIMIFANGIGKSLDKFDLKILIIAAFAFGIMSGFILRGLRKLRNK